MDILEVEKLAEYEMSIWGLIENGWRFEFSKAKKIFGMCRYFHRKISVSKVLAKLNSEEVVLDTIRHEIAHALAGSEAGHGEKWKRTAIMVGAKPEPYYGSEVVCPKPKIVASCKECGTSRKYYRKPKKGIVLFGVCGKCKNPLSWEGISKKELSKVYG